MLKKKISAIFVIATFITTSIILVPNGKALKIRTVVSPVEFVLNNGIFKYNDLDFFDKSFTTKNKTLAQKLGISEEEAFVIGNLGQYWSEKLMKGRNVFISKNNDLVFIKYGYRDRFYYSGYCIKNFEPCYRDNFERILNDIRNSEYKVVDFDTDEVYSLSDKGIRTLTNYIVVRKNQILRKPKTKSNQISLPKEMIKSVGNIKIYTSDSTSKLKPDRNCSSSICREILSNINKAQKTIDIAIYGYSKTPEIEKALKNAINRGVRIRLVYDSDTKGGNIYPDTNIIKMLIPDNKSDINSAEAKNIMHNKFYIFDEKVIITGSANLSHTDMSGFNSNSIAVIESKEAAKIYKTEFEQMYKGFFHNDKTSAKHKAVSFNDINIDIYFSPQDKCLERAVVPLIKRARKYIYIPTFVLTDKKVTEALIEAKTRGVDVKIIIDALNASVQHSKHNELRAGGVLVKTENYAGKMHSKSMIIDDKYTIIGSMNFSYSGENKNDENMLIIDSKEIAQSYKDFFLYQWDKIDAKWLKYNARAEGADSIGSCTDGIDNNYDGMIDMDDPACRKN